MGRFFPLLIGLLAGCDASFQERPAPPCEMPLPAPTGTKFDVAQTGTVGGVVRWHGALPSASVLESVDHPFEFASLPKRMRANPNMPRIAPKTQALAGAFVWLEGIDLARARPWNQTHTVRLVTAQRTLTPSRALMRAGAAVEFLSGDAFHHSLQLRGTNYVSLALPQPDRVRHRTLSKPGIVEVRSGSGFFWMRSYLLVQPHPYMAVTDAEGRFDFAEVPAGTYTLHGWHPSATVDEEERSPDTLRVTQVTFKPGWETTQRVKVLPGQPTELDVRLAGVP